MPTNQERPTPAVRSALMPLTQKYRSAAARESRNGQSPKRAGREKVPSSIELPEEIVPPSKVIQLKGLHKGGKAAIGPEKTAESDAGSEKSCGFENGERGSEDFRKELERLQIATTDPPVEQVPITTLMMSRSSFYVGPA